MNTSMNAKKNAARLERRQLKIDAGSVNAQFPEVAGIVIRMMHHQRGFEKSFPRVINFFPSSYAFFRVDCLNKECKEGGFDFTQVITEMINNRREAAKGDISCEGNGSSSGHSTISYKVAIQYA